MKLFKGIIQFTPGKLQAGKGTGLGLFISKGIVDKHNGYIWVESPGEGMGSTFTITIPVETASDVLEAKNSEVDIESQQDTFFMPDQVYEFDSALVNNDGDKMTDTTRSSTKDDTTVIPSDISKSDMTKKDDYEESFGKEKVFKNLICKNL